MVDNIKNILRHKEILKNLVIKNLKAKYAGSVLGLLWVFINPLLISLVIAFVFTQILKVNMKNFYLFIISGYLPWSFFAGSVQEASTAIVDNSAMLKQFAFPRGFLPVARVFSNFIIFLFGFAFILVFFIIINPQIIRFLPLLLIVFLFQLIFTLGVSLFFSSVYVYIRDISQFLGVLLLFWLWLTPVFYSVDMIPDKYGFIFRANPMSPFINLCRGIVYDPSLLNYSSIFLCLVFSLVSLLIGYSVFIKQEAFFLKRI